LSGQSPNLPAGLDPLPDHCRYLVEEGGKVTACSAVHRQEGGDEPGIGGVELSGEHLERGVDRLSRTDTIDQARQGTAKGRIGSAERLLQGPAHREARADRRRHGHDGLAQLLIDLIAPGSGIPRANRATDHLGRYEPRESADGAGQPKARGPDPGRRYPAQQPSPEWICSPGCPALAAVVACPGPKTPERSFPTGRGHRRGEDQTGDRETESA
jgi:hypothetical protein